MIGIFSRGICRIESLDKFLGSRWTKLPNSRTKSLTAVAGWGYKANTVKARNYAKKNHLPYLSLEDGFIRSLGLGVLGENPLSLVIDDLGIYYDSTGPSRLEALIHEGVEDPNSARAIEEIIQYKISKYNHAPERELPLKMGQRVLVIDQTFGDISVSLGGGSEAIFNQMLLAAIKENPQAEIIIKVHPDVLAGKKKGYLTNIPAESNVKLYAENISPLSLLEQVDKVYVVTSQMGFEALLLGKPVVCFGMPWYSGWGVSDDRHEKILELKKRRNVSRNLNQLFSAAYLRYPRYLNPFTTQGGTIFDVLEWLKLNKKMEEANIGSIYCVGMSLWKRAIVKPFLTGPSAKLHFVRSEKKVPQGAQVVSWGVKSSSKDHWRMEDGFIRSVGLGSDLFRPVSLVVDKGGMYYDPESGSDLEKMLQSDSFSHEDLERAKNFRESYVSMKMSKYNLGRSEFSIDAQGKKVILVPGQVEDDASIKRGTHKVKTNQELLQAVRKSNPNAYIMYKPHPDVVAGNRQGALTDSSFADRIVAEANIIDCIQASDELHTMTSLSGFEALIHGKIVHCYGGPFYAGWGPTIDHFELPHRTRKLTLIEMIFAVYLKYPRYILPDVNGFVRGEDVLMWLSNQSKLQAEVIKSKGLVGWLGRKRRKIKALVQLLT